MIKRLSSAPVDVAEDGSKSLELLVDQFELAFADEDEPALQIKGSVVALFVDVYVWFLQVFEGEEALQGEQEDKQVRGPERLVLVAGKDLKDFVSLRLVKGL